VQSKSKLKDPGIILVCVLILVAAIVLIWWPKDVYLMGISLAGWLMFATYFIWFAIGLIYIIWVEKLEKKE